MKEQIEKRAIAEMANVMMEHCEIDNQCGSCHWSTCNECLAEVLYNAGYRKQIEVIDNFVKRLLDAFPEADRNNRCPAIYYDDYRYIIEELAEEMKGGAE